MILPTVFFEFSARKMFFRKIIGLVAAIIWICFRCIGRQILSRMKNADVIDGSSEKDITDSSEFVMEHVDGSQHNNLGETDGLGATASDMNLRNQDLEVAVGEDIVAQATSINKNLCDG